jgi:cation diffusion facilitator family transporter
MTDLAVNAAVLIALGITKVTGWERADPIIALMISGYILWNAKQIAREVLLQLLDRELPDEDRDLIKKTVLACEGVKNIHDLRTRYAGDRSFVEFHLEVDGHLTVDQGHTIGDSAEAAVANALPGKTEVTCHLEPFGIDDERLDNRIKANEAKI